MRDICNFSLNVMDISIGAISFLGSAIGPKVCVGPQMAQEKVFGWSKFQKLASNTFDFY